MLFFCASKTTSKTFKNVEKKTDLAPLDLINYELCEMNGLLTREGKRYSMTLIDDITCYCYIYLLKSKYEALHYFKIYKVEVENQIERKIKRLCNQNLF